MTRVHKIKPGGRKYRDYTDETLQKCLEAVHGEKLTLQEAEKEFGIHCNTIHNKLKISMEILQVSNIHFPSTFNQYFILLTICY